MWALIAFPMMLIGVGWVIAWMDAFPEYRAYVGRAQIPRTLIESGRTGRQLNLLDYAPMAGLKLEGFDSSLTPGEMPSTTVLEPQARHSTLPLISVVVDPDDLYDRDSGLIANYDRRGRSWERPAYATYIRDGEIVWATGAGLRVHGGKSRTLPSKSFRLHFRKIYGQPDLARRLAFPGEGGATPINSLVLHNDMRTKLSARDDEDWHYTSPIAYEIAERIGCITVATEPVRFYVNGEYAGPYVLTEHLTTDFLKARFGHDDFFFADTKPERGSSPVKQGNVRELNELVDWSRGAPAPLSVAVVEEKVDLDNLTNWMISILYAGTTDAYQGFVARDRSKENGRWFWINWDMDHSFMDLYDQAPHPWEIDNFPGRGIVGRNRDARATLFNRLRTESPEYRLDFLTRLNEVLNHELTLEFMEDLVDRYEGIASAFGIEDLSYFDTIRHFARERPAVLREQMNTYFNAGPAYSLTVIAPEGKGLRVDGHATEARYSGWYFGETPATIEVSDHHSRDGIVWTVNEEELETTARTIELDLKANTVVRIESRQPGPLDDWQGVGG